MDTKEIRLGEFRGHFQQTFCVGVFYEMPALPKVGFDSKIFPRKIFFAQDDSEGRQAEKLKYIAFFRI